MHYRNYQALRLFVTVGYNMSITEAAKSVNLTKGALSYQIKQLEQRLEFDLFKREHGGLRFTSTGRKLFDLASSQFEQLEQGIEAISRLKSRIVTVGTTTYFASRWLTPRLMHFTSRHPDIRLRIQPTTGHVDHRAAMVDLAIEWGDGIWPDVSVEPLFQCPAFVTAGKTIAEAIENHGFSHALQTYPLLHDLHDSASWEEWFGLAGATYTPHQDHIVIEDPNVRVEAAVAGQGLVLNDDLVEKEINEKRLFKLSDTRLENYGYFITRAKREETTAETRLFIEWLKLESAQCKFA